MIKKLKKAHLEILEDRFIQAILFLFFGFWFFDFLSGINGSFSPFHGFYGSIEHLFYLAFIVTIFLLKLIAWLIGLGAVIAVANYIYELVTALRLGPRNADISQVHDATVRVSHAVARQPRLPRSGAKVPSSTVTAVAAQRPGLTAPVAPLKPKLTEEQVMIEALRRLRGGN